MNDINDLQTNESSDVDEKDMDQKLLRSKQKILMLSKKAKDILDALDKKKNKKSGG